MRFPWPVLALVLAACGGPEPLCEEGVDTDGDGLTDCEELDLGTDRNKADTDTDGLSDREEIECVSNPLDVNETCYACGWEHNDPGDLGPIGAAEGQTVENLRLIDQCGEKVDLHDFAGGYRILFMTAQWCTACLEEAIELPDRTTTYRDDLGVDFSYVIAIFQDMMGENPADEVAAEYADVIGVDKEIPVLADKVRGVVDHTPYEGVDLPGKCLLSPEMELLDCWTGHGADEAALDRIRTHAGL